MGNTQNGLTLIELMVVLAVMGIIATVAYPIYTDQVQKARRADAKVALESVAQAQERFYTINGEYTDTLADLDVSADIQGGNSDEGYYTVSVVHPDDDTQRFTATAQVDAAAAQAGDTDCVSFTVNQTGVKEDYKSGDTKNDPSECW